MPSVTIQGDTISLAGSSFKFKAAGRDELLCTKHI